ncbi:hypothetical protein MRX96_044090 [Rhipicephalus microplus]
MCCADDDVHRWVVLVRLFYGTGFGNSWEYAFTVHSMNVRRFGSCPKGSGESSRIVARFKCVTYAATRRTGEKKKEIHSTVNAITRFLSRRDHDVR